MNESVWAYPRPPRVEPCTHRATVIFGGAVIADSRTALRLLETSHPPTIYFPRDAVDMKRLQPGRGASVCEWKGTASYWDITTPSRAAHAAAWSYEHPNPAYASLTGYLSFYPSRVDACYLDEERVLAQEGDFYGGWITKDLRGPFKGGPATAGW